MHLDVDVKPILALPEDIDVLFGVTLASVVWEFGQRRSRKITDVVITTDLRID
jgi:hypothetical protein